MMTPSIQQAIVHIKNQDEIILLLVCDNYDSAEKLDLMLEGYVIRWDYINDSQVHFFLMSPPIGGYSFKGDKSGLKELDKVNFIASAYQCDTLDLKSFPARPLAQ